MRQWIRDHGLSCSQSRFTPASLSLSNSYCYPELKSKAHNCKVQLGWIASVCFDHQRRDGAHGILRASMTFALAELLWICDDVGHWRMSEAAAQSVYERGHEFLKCAWPGQM